MRTLAILVLALTMPTAAFAADSPWTTFDVLRLGLAPIRTTSELPDIKNKLNASILEFERLFTSNARVSNDKCVAFYKTTVALIKDIKKTLPKFTDVDATRLDRDNVYARSRLLFALPSMTTLLHLYRSGRDGGYGTVDTSAEHDCAYVDRPRVVAQFTNLIAELELFRQDTLGTPGLQTLEDLTDRLLTYADEQEVVHSRWTWGLAGATVISSIVVGWYAPAIIATTFNTSRGVARVAAYLAAVAENAAYVVGERLANPEADQRDIPLTPSFDEVVRDVNVLVEASFAEPQLYLAYLTSTQAKVAGMIGQWVQVNLKTIQQTVPK